MRGMGAGVAMETIIRTLLFALSEMDSEQRSDLI